MKIFLLSSFVLWTQAPSLLPLSSVFHQKWISSFLHWQHGLSPRPWMWPLTWTSPLWKALTNPAPTGMSPPTVPGTVPHMESCPEQTWTICLVFENCLLLVPSTRLDFVSHPLEPKYTTLGLSCVTGSWDPLPSLPLSFCWDFLLDLHYSHIAP